MAENEVVNSLPRDFSRVVLSLENVLLPEEKLGSSPSLIDGLDSDTEWDLRILGCELIQTSGILLKLPQVAMATGQVLFQRFYFSKSFVKHSMEILAMACVNLAAKIEEAPRRIRDIINVFHHIKQVKNSKSISPLILDQNYINLKNNVIKAERRVLKELGFCVHVQHPHKMIVMFLQVLECERNQRLVQFAWNCMNDSFRTMAFVKYQPETVACACIFLAARKLQIALPNNPHWFLLFHVQYEDILDICRQILQLYTRAKPDVEALEKKVNDAKKIHVEAKRKMKGPSSEGATPNSRPVSPSKASPSSVGHPGIKKIKSEDDHSDHSFGRDLDRPSRRKRGHSRSRSKSRSRGSSSGSDRDHRRHSSSKKHKHESRRVRDLSALNNDKSYRDHRYSDKYYDKHSTDKHTDRYADKYSDKYAKHDSKYDGFNYRDYKEYKHSSSKHRDSSYSPTLSPSHKKAYHRDRHRSRSRSTDRHRSKKHTSNGHSRDRYSSRR